MRLFIDAGNTRIKWAIAATAAAAAPNAASNAAPGQWLDSGAVAHAQLEELAPAWRAAVPETTIDQVWLSNVAGETVAARLQQLLACALPHLLPDATCWFASPGQLGGLRNGYRNPAQLGSDRFAAALGARALAPGVPLIVANCGTATTIDAVSAEGVFLGGMILPGLAMMRQALARGTACLPQVGQASSVRPGFADNTDDAIRSGCLSAQAGAIERAHAAHGAVQCMLSGGAAPAIAPALGVPYRLVDNLVLIGLQVAASCIDGEKAC